MQHPALIEVAITSHTHRAAEPSFSAAHYIIRSWYIEKETKQIKTQQHTEPNRTIFN